MIQTLDWSQKLYKVKDNITKNEMINVKNMPGKFNFERSWLFVKGI